jgi:N-methylhydantoinase A
MTGAGLDLARAPTCKETRIREEAMRLACDTGGTFTDLVVEADGQLRMYKASTTADDPVEGVLDVLTLAAEDAGSSCAAFLAQAETFIHGTTRAINAILTGKTARTAFLTTEGHPDVLVIREGGRIEPFNFTVPYPEPYVPRALTFEIPERIDAAGKVVKPLDEAATLRVVESLRAKEVEAVGVCLLWSIANPCHEVRVGEILAEHLPGVPLTLSHRLNPTLREYRRASSTCIDASLKPLMYDYLHSLTARLRAAGFSGRVLMVTSQGGIMDAEDVAAAPIHAIGSGPAMAPVAGRHYAAEDSGAATAVVADTGGTSYDVSLVREGRIPWTRETWLGQRFRGHMTGFPSVDVKSIGAGGGSIAWVDSGGLLHVGPQSAGSTPGPACYGAGGSEPTVTDCALLLGYIDPAFFLGGAMRLDRDAAARALQAHVTGKLGLAEEEAAAAVLALATEKMVGAIQEITINQGIDPGTAVLLAGGGAAGLNAVAVARRLGCARVIVPAVGAALSAAGALMSELSAEYAQMTFTTSERFDHDTVNGVLADLKARCQDFIAGPGEHSLEQTIEYTVEARYPHQIWEIEVPLRRGRFDGDADVQALVADFHAAHKALFEISDSCSGIEAVTWRARVRCRLRDQEAGRLAADTRSVEIEGARRVYFAGHGWVEAAVRRFEALAEGEVIDGPAVIESSFSTVVIDPGAAARRMPSGSLSVTA